MTDLGLVADAGGTNVRFALVGADGKLRAPKKFTSRDYPGIADAAKAYLGESGEKPSRGVFAVAGPVRDNAIHMTNIGWSFSGDDVANALGMERVTLINDF